LGVPDRCGECHNDLFSLYAMSTHGALTELGYGPAATCADCHGAHDVLPASDAASKTAPGNRVETCRKCHPVATANYMDFDPHANHHNPDRDPVLYWVYMVLMTFLIGTFSCFGLHSVLWFGRSLIHVMQHGRPKPLAPGDVAYVRFGPFHRMAHIIMVMSFLGLALTGLPLKYSHYEWAKVLARGLGGFAFTAYWHRMFGVVNIACLVVYAFRLASRVAVPPAAGTSRLGVIFGTDSPVPNLRDVKDVLRAIRWFLGLGPKPTFERWAYWEKFDFWGACADIVIIGTTGLILWFPDSFCSFFSGRLLNIAKVIHSTQALLATGFVFAIHFFATHLRPEKFPMDKVILIGLVSEEELLEERPDYLKRMHREGKLHQLRGTVPHADILRYISLGGFVALAIGLGLLVGILVGAIGG
jgi:cytochrome b subunit of formate dehydrogenase